ncbi:rhamnulokinase [Candidatus Poribacteria bacterium]|nr:rhamnulokinase [Candidatus Poribacteria bacterium]
MSDKAKFLAFDIGASSGRGVLGTLEHEKLELQEVHRFPNGPVHVLDSLHWDVLLMQQELKHAMETCAREFGSDIDGMGVDTWGVDFGLVGRNNTLLGHPYHYRDKLTDGMMEEAFKTVPKEEIFRITGIQFMKLNTLYQLLAMSLMKSPLLDVTEVLLLMPDLFNFLFTGQRVSEFTIATTTQFYDPTERNWSKPLFDKLGLPFHILPEIVPAGTEIGTLLPDIQEEVGLGKVPVIAPACHDTGCAVAAVPAKGENWAYISSGTWSLVGVEVPDPIINSLTLKYNFTNEGGVGGTIRLLKNVTGMWLIQECKRIWEEAGENYSYDEITKMAEDAQPFNCIIEPNYEPFLSPCDMPERIREFCKDTGQKIPETKPAVIRCAFESLALKYRWVLEKLEEVLEQELDVVHIIGGGCQNKFLCQLTADATGKQVLAGPVEATAIGNIIIQAITIGYLDSIDSARELIAQSFDVVAYEPRPDKRWNDVYSRYLEIMEKTVGL